MMRLQVTLFTTALIAAGWAGSPAAQAESKLEVFPSDIKLQHKRETQRMVVRVVDDNGVSHDVTEAAKFTVVDPTLAQIEGGVARALADGASTVNVEFEGRTTAVPLTVAGAAVEPPISFRRDVMPIFLKAGCNTGGCHGQASGKDGFRLSLFGFDPDGDYHRLTREMSGRRINVALPEESLLVEKSIGAVAHTGGKRFEKGSDLYQTLVSWIEAGAPQDAAEMAKPVSMEILPKHALLEGEKARQTMTVRATYSDGSVRDVTPLAVFLSSNDNSAKIDDRGVVTAGARGEAFVMARFATFTEGAQIVVIPKGLTYAFPPTPERNFIDTLVNNKLRTLRILPSELCTDEAFVRRVYLDTIGLLPTVEEQARFIGDSRADKREKLIDELLARPEFVDMWVMKWAELLQIRSSDQISYKTTLLYYNWLKDRFARNVPINDIVRELIPASGGTLSTPAASYYQAEADPLKLAEDTAQAFLGIRMQCAQCHNHPFDRWTMEDYRGLVGFFAQVGRKKGEDPRETIVFNSGGGDAKHPVTNQPVAPKFPGGETPDVKGKDRRQVLAEWLAAPDNPYFPRHMANVVWASFFGVGIIDPVDDVRISNPASNPELLEALGKKFVEYNYDFKRLVRDICNSHTYQLSTRTNETNNTDSRNFAHGAIRRVRAEVMLDAISSVTETKNKFQGLPLGARAVQIADGQTSSYFLKTFGRATRETVCSCEVVMEPNLSQALHLLNGDTVQKKIQEGALVKRLLAERSPREVVENLYLRSVSRPPTSHEISRLEPMWNAAKEPQKAIEDIFWALLNSKEFMFNH